MNKNQPKATHRNNNSRWLDSEDMELIFINSIAICVLLLAILIGKIFV